MVLYVDIETRIARIEQLIHVLLQASRDKPALYLGENRLLVRALHKQLLYLVPANDIMTVPRFAISGLHEPTHTNYVINTVKPGAICVDVGASFGYYSCLLARLAGRSGKVFAFEADPYIYDFNHDNIILNLLHGIVRTHNVAVSDLAGELTLYRRAHRYGNTSVVVPNERELRMRGEEPERLVVPAIALDSMKDEIGAVDLLKVDVEGAELIALRGMRELVRGSPNIKILMEWSPEQTRGAGSDPRELINELALHDLKPHLYGKGGNLIQVSLDRLAQANFQNIVLLR